MRNEAPRGRMVMAGVSALIVYTCVAVAFAIIYFGPKFASSASSGDSLFEFRGQFIQLGELPAMAPHRHEL